MSMGSVPEGVNHVHDVSGSNKMRLPSPSRPRASSTEKTVMMTDMDDGYSAVNPFETDANGDVALHYAKIQGLQEKHLKALKAMDIDDSGTVSLSEVLSSYSDTTRLSFSFQLSCPSLTTKINNNIISSCRCSPWRRAIDP